MPLITSFMGVAGLCDATGFREDRGEGPQCVPLRACARCRGNGPGQHTQLAVLMTDAARGSSRGDLLVDFARLGRVFYMTFVVDDSDLLYAGIPADTLDRR